MKLNEKDLELIAKIDERLKHYKLITDNEQQSPVETDETPVFWVSFENVDGFNPKKIYTAKISKGLMVSYNDYGHTYYFKTEKAIFHTYEEYIANAEILSNEAPVEWKVGVWAEPITEQKERWQPAYGCKYWYIGIDDGNIFISDFHWGNDDVDFIYHDTANCFKTQEEAERAAQAIRETLKNL